MIMARAGMIFVKLFVGATKLTMIGPVLGPAVEAFLMRPFVGPADIVMKLLVPVMIPGVTIVIIMREGRYRGRDQQDCGREQTSAEHGCFPLPRSDVCSQR